MPDPIVKAARSALTRGGELVYARGLLHKGVGLCHGISGSVYSLLAVADVLDDHMHEEWFMRAIHLAHLACAYEKLTSEGKMGTPDKPYSLYEGVAGMCCAWADVLDGLGANERSRAAMPAYNDLRHFD